MNFKILVFGLPGSGKTFFSKKLVEAFKLKNKDVCHFNADEIRTLFKDFDFSQTGRIRQAVRMLELVNIAKKPSIVDFVCPYDSYRYQYDLLIWMNTIKEGRFEDTNKIFQKPKKFDFEIKDFNYEEIIKDIVYSIESGKITWKNWNRFYDNL